MRDGEGKGTAGQVPVLNFGVNKRPLSLRLGVALPVRCGRSIRPPVNGRFCLLFSRGDVLALVTCLLWPVKTSSTLKSSRSSEKTNAAVTFHIGSSLS